ncbi:MAG: hypothetical protein EBR82_28840 [Caulobacteraceae bacterium]|nr:hypothetical protein [Caulobacteraceae bacterium]
MSEFLTFKTLGPGPIYSQISIWLPQLIHEAGLRGESLIEGKTFSGCRIQGPAVIVPISGCHFEACALGASDGDMRNLMFQPLGPAKITGAIAFRDCRFERCDFLGVGYTGSADFIAELRSIDGPGALA